MKIGEPEKIGNPINLYEELENGEVRIRFVIDNEIGEWIPCGAIYNLAHSMLWLRRHVHDHERIWPCPKGSVLEILRNSPMYGNSAPAIERILTRSDMKPVCDNLCKHGSEETLERFLGKIFGLFSRGILRKPTEKSEINGLLKRVQSKATELATLLRELEKKVRSDYRISYALTDVYTLFDKTVGFRPRGGSRLTHEEVMEDIKHRRSEVSTLLEVLAKESESSINPKLSDDYIGNNQDGSICEGTLIFWLNKLLTECYGKPLHGINTMLVNIIMDKADNQLTESSLQKRLKGYKQKSKR